MTQTRPNICVYRESDTSPTAEAGQHTDDEQYACRQSTTRGEKQRRYWFIAAHRL